MVGRVQREDVGPRADEEEAHDAEEQVDGSDGRVDALGGTRVGETRDEERGTDQEVRDVVERVDLEDAEEQTALRGDETDTAVVTAKPSRPTRR